MVIHFNKHPNKPSVNLEQVAGYYPNDGILLLNAPLLAGYNPITRLNQWYTREEMQALLAHTVYLTEPAPVSGFTRVTIPDIQVPT